MANAFDVLVIGSGPGGYVCALRAAQLGMNVACVEKRETLGGTCLNIGCIPSKALLQSSENFAEAAHAFADHGVMVEGVRLDLARMQARKDEVVTANVKGVEYLFNKNKVTWLKGAARIVAPGRVEVGGTEYAAKHIVHRHRQREHAAARRRGRREADRDFHRRARSRGRARASRRHRRRLYRARARQRLAPAGRRRSPSSSFSTASCPAWTPRSQSRSSAC